MQIRNQLSYSAQSDYKKLDFFLKANGVSRKIITALKYIGCLQINGKPATTVQPVYQGDTVTLIFPPEQEISCEPQRGSFEILYEDEDILAVNKPSGIATHPAAGTKSGTLGNYVTNYYLENGYTIPFRPVSRLDKDTSGVILIAKHKFAHHALSEQMKQNCFQKKYLALVSPVPLQPSGEINLPIARESENSMLRVCRSDGKSAHTIYRVIGKAESFALLEAEPKTGRTHQIRVHLKAIGHPIIGDVLYGTIPAERLYLHSYSTSFFHPVTGKEMTIQAPCCFHEKLQTIRKEESLI